MSFATLLSISFGIGITAQLLFAGFVVAGIYRGFTGRALLTVAIAQLAFLAAAATTGPSPLTGTLEAFVALAWALMFQRILGLTLDNFREPERRWQLRLFGVVAALAAAAVGIEVFQPAAASASDALRAAFFAQLALAIACLVTLEQVSRNTLEPHRWRLRYLNLGAGTILAFAIVHQAYAVLMGEYAATLLVVQPIILTLGSALVVVASLRNRRNRLAVNLSHTFVFRSSVLVAVGVYLILTGLAGYYITLFEGAWGKVLGALFATISLLALAIMAGSAPLRRHVRVLVLRTFFEYKYDYRDEWLSVTQELSAAQADSDLPHQTIRLIGELVNSSGGTLWWLSQRGVLVPIAQLNSQWRTPFGTEATKALVGFFEERLWIVDLREYRAKPEAYPGLNLGDSLRNLGDGRFIVPLPVGHEVHGMVVLTEPVYDLKLMWEDYDILKLVARQAGGMIALRRADQKIADSKRLHAYHQMSAFLVHDLKTITGQLSLLLENAEKHKTKPAFIDDMLATTENAVDRMKRLLSQLRQEDASQVSLVELRSSLQQLLARFTTQAPNLSLPADDVHISVPIERSRLESALGHVIQNALDATVEEGSVTVVLEVMDSWARVEVRDTGPGMTPEFVRNELFAPFQSTKGVAGMGIGAYQARETVRDAGGELLVQSAVDEGTVFSFLLPLQPDSDPLTHPQYGEALDASAAGSA